MANYLYGAATTFLVVVMVQVINDHIPNSLGYYLSVLFGI